MRQDTFRRLLALLTYVVTLGLTGRANATVVWTATLEKGDLSEWRPGINAAKGARQNVEVLAEQVHTGKFACKITVPPDDTFNTQNRVDIQHQSTLTAEGKQLWLSGYYMMPEDAKARNEFAFFESNVSFQNVMDFWVEPKNGGGATIRLGPRPLPTTKPLAADL